MIVGVGWRGGQGKARPERVRGRGGRAYFRKYGLAIGEERKEGLVGHVRERQMEEWQSKQRKIVEKTQNKEFTREGEGRKGWRRWKTESRAGHSPFPPSCSWHLCMLLVFRHPRPSCSSFSLPLALFVVFPLLLSVLHAGRKRRYRAVTSRVCVVMYL
jgi:hypothetical protein